MKRAPIRIDRRGVTGMRRALAVYRPRIQPRPPAVLPDGLSHLLAYEPAPPAHYLDYGHSLTPGGGVLITYKDIDTRWRWHLWRACAWLLATAIDYFLAFQLSPLDSELLNSLGWILAAGLNLLIVCCAIDIRRRIEIRPDCLILDNREVFWCEHMEGGLPELRLQDEKEETFVLGGVYGTRFVEFGILRRFDANDRQPETFGAHFKLAIEQLWDAG